MCSHADSLILSLPHTHSLSATLSHKCLIGFRWSEGIIWKMYGTLEFFDVYAQNGFTGRPWVVYPDDAPEGTTVGSAYNWITLWSASSADNFKSMLGGASPELLPVSGDFVGTLNNSTFTKLLNEYAEEHHIESVIGGIGENPETENPWCFFVEARTRFVCYVGESFQVCMLACECDKSERERG
jgi:hypothetical protein